MRVCAIRSRHIVHAARRGFSSDQLAAFPEYQTFVDLQKKGNLASAATALSRVHEVLGHAIGADAPMTNSVFFQLAGLAQAQGHFDKCDKMVRAQTFSNVKDQINREVFLANSSLLQGKADVAIHHSGKAVDLVEGQDASMPDNTLFSNAYSSLGVSSLYGGDVADAETFLQMAARWATTPLEDVSALNNIGSLSWFKLAAGVEVPQLFNLWAWEEDEASRDLKLRPESTEGFALSFLAAADKTADSHPVISAALGSWGEAITTLGKQNLSDNVHIAIAAATVQANHATMLYLLGKTKDSNDLLAEAVKILTPHDVAFTQPLLGSVLRKIAFIHMKATQAVTAEGLFNAATSKLQSAYGKHDIRYQYEVAVVKGLYGQLLSKWDKREPQGMQAKQDAQAALARLPSLAHGVRLSPALMLPQIQP